MNTRRLMILSVLGSRPEPLTMLLVQITGALYLGFAMLDWMTRESLIGGIYGRPVAFGRLLFTPPREVEVIASAAMTGRLR